MIGVAYGYKQGSKIAGKGHEQFDRLKAERNGYAKQTETLEHKVVSLTQELDEHKVKHGEGKGPRADQGGFTAAHAAEKEVSTPTDISR